MDIISTIKKYFKMLIPEEHIIYTKEFKYHMKRDSFDKVLDLEGVVKKVFIEENY